MMKSIDGTGAGATSSSCWVAMARSVGVCAADIKGKCGASQPGGPHQQLRKRYAARVSERAQGEAGAVAQNQQSLHD